MPGGGVLVIDTRNVVVDERMAAAISGMKSGEYVMVAVRDTGGGMTQQVMSRAFDPFFTTKETGKGTGLGLSQVYGFARQSGGSVAIESAPATAPANRRVLPQNSGASLSKSGHISVRVEIELRAGRKTMEGPVTALSIPTVVTILPDL
jgi:signal transduction histidine kinase